MHAYIAKKYSIAVWLETGGLQKKALRVEAYLSLEPSNDVELRHELFSHYLVGLQ